MWLQYVLNIQDREDFSVIHSRNQARARFGPSAAASLVGIYRNCIARCCTASLAAVANDAHIIRNSLGYLLWLSQPLQSSLVSCLGLDEVRRVRRNPPVTYPLTITGLRP